MKNPLLSWPAARQLTGRDRSGRGEAARSQRTAALQPRTHRADRLVQSICPFCAVGCGQRVYVQNEVVTQIEGDPDSPISRGRLCPKGAASRNLVQSPLREYKVKYRPPYGKDWQNLPLELALDMIADRVIAARAEGWQKTTPKDAR